MLKTRVIPVLLFKGEGLVKTKRFKDPVYVGDPINAIKIFNEKGVDELVFLDIDATRLSRGPNYTFINKIADECFMPLAYGGGVRSINEIREILKLGVEKVIINTAAFEINGFIKEAAIAFGSSTIVVSIDYRKKWTGSYRCYTQNGKNEVNSDPVSLARQAEEEGAGEILLNAIDNDGMMKGYNLDILENITRQVSVPVIACGGAGHLSDFRKAVVEGGASAVAAGSLFVFYGPHKAVLINYPSMKDLETLFT
jgi:imidazole glycerol-phosphate synthase subunit HisF